MSVFTFAFFAACFGAGCILAAGTARRQGMLGMVKLWTVLSALSFLACVFLILAGIIKSVL
jgi:hypothetical protein